MVRGNVRMPFVWECPSIMLQQYIVLKRFIVIYFTIIINSSHSYDNLNCLPFLSLVPIIIAYCFIIYAFLIKGENDVLSVFQINIQQREYYSKRNRLNPKKCIVLLIYFFLQCHVRDRQINLRKTIKTNSSYKIHVMHWRIICVSLSISAWDVRQSIDPLLEMEMELIFPQFCWYRFPTNYCTVHALLTETLKIIISYLLYASEFCTHQIKYNVLI